MPSYWRAGKSSSSQADSSTSTQDEARQPLLGGSGGAAASTGAYVQVRDLRKVFHSSEGSVRVAVEGLTLDMCAGRITALLGHNGAGKVGGSLVLYTGDAW
jgi:ABC-type glutathione transport system ATPase component